MKLNKMGIQVRKNIGGFLNTLLGRATSLERAESRLYDGVILAGNVDLDNQAKKTLLELELRESQAFELIRKFQNC